MRRTLRTPRSWRKSRRAESLVATNGFADTAADFSVVTRDFFSNPVNDGVNHFTGLIRKVKTFLRIPLLQVNFFQKHLFLHQLIHNMTKDCSLNVHENSKLRTCCVHKLFFVFVLTFRTIYVHNMFSTCSELRIFMY